MNGGTFATLNGTLYFLGQQPKGEFALFKLAMHDGGKAAAMALTLPVRDHDYLPYALAANPLDGRIYLATRTKDDKNKPISVFRIDPVAGTIETAFRFDGSDAFGLAIDPAKKVIYVGTGEIHALTADGQELSGFPVPAMKTPAIPTNFRGHVSVAAGALWDTAHYGFLSRHDLLGAPGPGRLTQWNHDLYDATQFIGLLPTSDSTAADPMAITCSEADTVYIAAWEKSSNSLQFLHRLGSLPTITGIALSVEGDVVIGIDRATLWYDWNDAADAVPRKAEMHILITPAIFHGPVMFGFGAQYHLHDGSNVNGFGPMRFPRRSTGSNEAERALPALLPAPKGLAAQFPHGPLFVTDSVSKQILRAPFDPDSLSIPAGTAWQPIKIDGTPLAAPGDIIALTDGRLIVADAGTILFLEPKADTYHVSTRFIRWGDNDADHFGARLRLAADGALLAVADTDRQRVVCFDLTESTPGLLTQFGQTDTPGDDFSHLHDPRQIAIKADRAIVADAGNQRVIKLVIR